MFPQLNAVEERPQQREQLLRVTCWAQRFWESPASSSELQKQSAAPRPFWFHRRGLQQSWNWIQNIVWAQKCSVGLSNVGRRKKQIQILFIFQFPHSIIPEFITHYYLLSILTGDLYHRERVWWCNSHRRVYVRSWKHALAHAVECGPLLIFNVDPLLQSLARVQYFLDNAATELYSSSHYRYGCCRPFCHGSP